MADSRCRGGWVAFDLRRPDPPACIATKDG